MKTAKLRALPSVLIASALCFLVTGCATQPTTIRADVSVFHKLAAGSTPVTYAFAPFDDQRRSLEFDSYAQQVRNQLTAKGWQESAPETASVFVSLQYSIDEPTQKLISYPIWGQTGVASATTTGNTTTFNPSYGVAGTGTTSVTTYRRFLTLQVVDGRELQAGTVKPLYEATVRSEGSNGNLPLIVPYLIRSIFIDFPGESGSARREELPCPNCP